MKYNINLPFKPLWNVQFRGVKHIHSVVQPPPLAPGRFHSPKGDPTPSSHSPPSFLPRGNHQSALCVWIGLPWTCHVDGITHYVALYVWFLSLSMTFLRFAHIACVRASFLFMAEYYSTMQMGHALLTHSSGTDLWVSVVWSLWIGLLYTFMYKVLFEPIFSSLGYMPRNGIAGWEGNPLFNLLRSCQAGLHSGCSTLHSHQRVWGVYCLHSLTNTYVPSFGSPLSSRAQGESPCGLDLCLPDSQWQGPFMGLPMFVHLLIA